MRLIFSLFFVWPLFVFGAAELKLDGTLFKKDQKWFIFVQSEDATFKKGTLELKNIPPTENKYLVEKAYVRIYGSQFSCGSAMCIAVKTIKPALFDPLKDRGK